MKPHKHAEIIKAWADGAEIEYRFSNVDTWTDSEKPEWNISTQYRIKPEPKPDVIAFALTNNYGSRISFSWCFGCDEPHNIRVTFDGETGQLKAAEVLK